MGSLTSFSHLNDQNVEFESPGGVELTGKGIRRSWYKATNELVCSCLRATFDADIRPIYQDLKRLAARFQGHISAPTAYAEIALVVSKKGTSIQLRPTILITSYTKTCKHAIKKQFKGECTPTYLSSSGLPFYVTLKRNRTWWAANFDVLMDRLASNAQKDGGMGSLSMKIFSFNTSPCGRMAKFEFILNGKTARRYSRVGGVIELWGKFFVLTTAHALVLPISEPSVRGSTSWQQSLNTTDNSPDTDQDVSGDSDDDSQWCEQSPSSSAVPPNVAEEGSVSAVDLSTTAHFQEVDSKISWCFGNEHTPELKQLPGLEEGQPHQNQGFDWALLEISDSMIDSATNVYYQMPPHLALGIQVNGVTPDAEMSSGPVHVLFSSRQPAGGHLNESVISMYHDGMTFLVRHI